MEPKHRLQQITSILSLGVIRLITVRNQGTDDDGNLGRSRQRPKTAPPGTPGDNSTEGTNATRPRKGAKGKKS